MLLVLFRLRPRQQHARLDLGQHRGHHQVLGRQFQAQVLHQVDVLHVLVGDVGDRDVEDVQVLAADQIQQQVERPLEGIEEHLQRIRRDVQVLGQVELRLSLHDGERHLFLLRRDGFGRVARSMQIVPGRHQ